MKRFVSRLKPLLRLRQQQEKLAALQMAAAARQVEQAQQELQQQQTRQQEATRSTEQLLASQPAGGQLHAGRQHLEWQALQVARQQQTVNIRQQQQRHAARQRMAAWKDLQVAEQASQKEREQYQLEQQREQTADIVDRASHDSLAGTHEASQDVRPSRDDGRPPTPAPAAGHSAVVQKQESPS